MSQTPASPETPPPKRLCPTSFYFVLERRAYCAGLIAAHHTGGGLRGMRQVWRRILRRLAAALILPLYPRLAPLGPPPAHRGWAPRCRGQMGPLRLGYRWEGDGGGSGGRGRIRRRHTRRLQVRRSICGMPCSAIQLFRRIHPQRSCDLTS